MIQLTLVTTLFGAASAAAAIDAGLLGDPDERVLVVANNAPIPEVVPSLAETPGVAPVLARFDRVVDLGALLSPQQPSRWRIEAIDAPMQEKLLRSHWALGDAPVELVVESVHVPPAATLAEIFYSSRITILSEGLMSYGPTRDPQPHAFGQRLTGMVYLDLVDGLDPLLLSEHRIAYRPIAPEHFRALLDEVCADAGLTRHAPDEPTALVLGQYLAALRLVTPAEESAMQVSMLTAARELGATRVLFKPHPSAPSTNTAELVAAAKEVGLSIELADPRVSAEAIMATHTLVGVVAGFSTALATAARVFGLPTRAIATEVMFRQLKPYQNSNRIPLTIVDFLDRNGGLPDPVASLRPLTVAVAYTMQPDTLAHRRLEAVEFLENTSEEVRRRYFVPSRLGRLGLPGGPVPSGAVRAARRALERVPPGIAAPAYGYVRRARASRGDDPA